MRGARRRLALLAALGAAAALSPRAAGAQQGQSCRISSVVGIVFGSYDPFAPGDLVVTGSITHQCPNSRPPRISLGTGNSASFTPRELWLAGSGGFEILQYDLCLDLQCTMVWGDGSPGTHEYVATTGRATVTVYGRVRAGQDPVVGSYGDTVTVTINL
jgi:spore coat protein U-like protein